MSAPAVDSLQVIERCRQLQMEAIVQFRARTSVILMKENPANHVVKTTKADKSKHPEKRLRSRSTPLQLYFTNSSATFRSVFELQVNEASRHFWFLIDGRRQIVHEMVLSFRPMTNILLEQKLRMPESKQNLAFIFMRQLIKLIMTEFINTPTFWTNPENKYQSQYADAHDNPKQYTVRDKQQFEKYVGVRGEIMTGKKWENPTTHEIVEHVHGLDDDTTPQQRPNLMFEIHEDEGETVSGDETDEEGELRHFSQASEQTFGRDVLYYLLAFIDLRLSQLAEEEPKRGDQTNKNLAQQNKWTPRRMSQEHIFGDTSVDENCMLLRLRLTNAQV